MILLGTDLVLETMRPQPSPRLIGWLDAQPAIDLYLSAPSLADISCAISRLREQTKRESLREAVERLIHGLFSGRILAFDQAAALRYGPIIAQRKAAGAPLSEANAMIAAIALHHNATLATGDISGFDGLELNTVNPFA